MRTDTVDASQRTAARVAGATDLLMIAIVMLSNFGIHARLIVPRDAARTARNILAHEALFRLGVVCFLAYGAGIIVLLTALYVVLRKVSRHLAVLAAFFRLVYAVVWIQMTVTLLIAVRVLKGADYLQVFGVDRLQALARAYLSGSESYYVGLVFLALASALCGYLWLKSGYIPAILAIGGLAASAWCVLCTLAFLIFPNFSDTVNLWWFDSPMALFEIATSVWLLTKGLTVPEIEPLPGNP
jgi:hypothetical protein